jgi:RNA polymerase sigma-70 factor (family 1)
MTDTQIIKGVNQKLPEAFNQIFDKLYASLCMYANRIIDDREESKDLVAKAFLVLWEKERDFEDLSHLKAFLYTVTRNACIDHVKSSKIQEEQMARITQQIDISEQQIERAINEAEILKELYAAIKKLPNRCRKAFILTHLEGLSRSEAATRLGVSENTLKNQVQFAKKRLRAMLGEKGLSLALLLIDYAFLKN